MSAAQRPWAAELLHFWFEKLGPRDWFRGGSHVDKALRERFECILLALFTQPAESFLSDPKTARAAVLLFDQLPRNLYRGTVEQFAFDPLARTIARGALALGWNQGLDKPRKQFLAMPLMHSEAIADQLLSLRYYTALGDPFIRRFALNHYRMVARFGRFPHRNALLGRKSTPAEIAAIAAGNSW
ncbi:MAG TPA: DUF924 family protein [Sphingomonadaceae bacterium]|nr:DUF924 family protein [Sphingomonadaceae bacterium]